MSLPLAPHDQFQRSYPRAVAIVIERLLVLSREMGADFKKIGWFAPYDGDPVPVPAQEVEEAELEEALA